jgi:hypothetical protein
MLLGRGIIHEPYASKLSADVEILNNKIIKINDPERPTNITNIIIKINRDSEPFTDRRPDKVQLQPVLGGMDGNLHFPVPSMNRLNQTEPSTFSVLSF